MMERLQKIIARAGVASRRKAEELIREGRVTVNGQVVKELGAKADGARDHIKVNGKLLHLSEELVYVMLHKPPRYVTTASDPQGRPTIFDLLRGLRRRVFPVGRLEYHAEGLLFLTNDGELGNWWSAARLPQTYWIKIKGKLNPVEVERLRAALPEAGASLRLLKDAPNAWYECTFRGSRRDPVRVALQRAGHPVEKIKRVRMGPLDLGRLESGAFRSLTAKELQAIRRLRAAPKGSRDLAQAV